jgi:sterol desaturase/sphingolipid hydroxylase (fatty acid hydroxylase superfamily)
LAILIGRVDEPADEQESAILSFEYAIEQASNDTLIYWFLPIFLIALALEAAISHRYRLNLFESQDTKASLWMMLMVGVVDVLPKIVAFWVFLNLAELSPLKDIVVRQWWAWVLLFFADDFIYYWFHRANHEIRLFWAGHVSHHSAVKMNFATALRQGVGERLHKYLFWIPLPLLGFDALMIFTVMAINLFYQFWVHVEWIKKMPSWYEAIFNTPSHHRVHHASNIPYLDRNHGGVLIVWDRLFGTFAREQADEPVRYGLTKPLDSYDPINVATHDYHALWRDVRGAKTWRDKLAYMFLAPGWHHAGPDSRSNTLRAKHQKDSS